VLDLFRIDPIQAIRFALIFSRHSITAFLRIR
jgi:hypothetical protein